MSASRRKAGHAGALSAKSHEEGSPLTGNNRQETGFCQVEIMLFNSPPK